MSEFQPRNPDSNALLLFLGGAVLLILCVGSTMLFDRYNPGIIATPTLAPLPAIVEIPVTSTTATALPALIYPAPEIATIAPTLSLQEIAPASIGTSCTYGPSWINAVATPIPDGGHSAIQEYVCANGYWYLGTKDWVDGAGNWGTDGIDESAFIAYYADGSIADRKFKNLQGTAVPGPTN